MFSHNLSDENGVKVTPECSSEDLQPVGYVSDNHWIWELGLQGGKQLAMYYLDLVKIHLHQPDVKSNTQLSKLQQLRVNKERLEIQEYIKNFRKQR